MKKRNSPNNPDDRLKAIFPKEDHSSKSWKAFISDFNRSIQIHRGYLEDERKERNGLGRRRDIAEKKIKEVKKFISFLQKNMFPDYKKPLMPSSYMCETNFKRDERYVTLIDLLNQELDALKEDLLYTKNSSHRPTNDRRKWFCGDLMTILYNHLAIKPTVYRDGDFSEYLAYGIERLENHSRPYDAANVYRIANNIGKGLVFQDKVYEEIGNLPLEPRLTSVGFEDLLNEFQLRQKETMAEYERLKALVTSPEDKALLKEWAIDLGIAPE